MAIHKQIMTRQELNHVFEDRYPGLLDLLPYGGTPGMSYALVHSANIGRRQSAGWGLVSRLPVIIIRITKGQHAGDHSAMLMEAVDPIEGAGFAGSVRPYFVEKKLDDVTGLGPPPAAEAHAATSPTSPKKASGGEVRP